MDTRELLFDVNSTLMDIETDERMETGNENKRVGSNPKDAEPDYIICAVRRT